MGLEEDLRSMLKETKASGIPGATWIPTDATYNGREHRIQLYSDDYNASRAAIEFLGESCYFEPFVFRVIPDPTLMFNGLELAGRNRTIRGAKGIAEYLSTNMRVLDELATIPEDEETILARIRAEEEAVRRRNNTRTRLIREPPFRANAPLATEPFRTTTEPTREYTVQYDFTNAAPEAIRTGDWLTRALFPPNPATTAVTQTQPVPTTPLVNDNPIPPPIIPPTTRITRTRAESRMGLTTEQVIEYRAGRRFTANSVAQWERILAENPNILVDAPPNPFTRLFEPTEEFDPF